MFCELVAEGKAASHAYSQAFNSKNEGTCKVGGSRLLKLPEICARIAELQGVNKQISEKVKTKAIEATEGMKIGTAAQRMELLTKIYNGEMKIPRNDVKYNPAKGKFEKIKMVELPSHSARVAAINEHNKMDGSHKALKVAQTDTEGNSIPMITLTLPAGMDISLPSNTDGEDEPA